MPDSHEITPHSSSKCTPGNALIVDATGHRESGFGRSSVARCIKQEALYKFKAQQLVDLRGVIPVPLEMSSNDRLQSFSFDIWPRKTH